MGYILVVISALLGVVSQMLLKQSARIQHLNWVREYLNPWVIGGYSIMVISLIINLIAIHLGVLAQEVSIIECINYLLIPLAAWLIFREPLNKRKVVAIVVIMAGVVVFFL